MCSKQCILYTNRMQYSAWALLFAKKKKKKKLKKKKHVGRKMKSRGCSVRSVLSVAINACSSGISTKPRKSSRVYSNKKRCKETLKGLGQFQSVFYLKS